jgi:hypothetical protein
MKTIIFFVVSLFLAATLHAQEVQSLFGSARPSGGYGAISNKFTTIRGEYANIAEVYGGWFIKKRFLLGLEAAASTNNLSVPQQYSTSPWTKMTWQYGQAGLMTEYVLWSNRAVHFSFSLFGGGGFTLQYERQDWDEWDDDSYDDLEHDENFFTVIEPGAQVEVNLFKWLRLCPGVSYRKSFGSDGIGMSDSDISDWSYNVTVKVGKF